MWSGPLLSLIVGIILYYRAGYAGLVGITVIFIVVPIQGMVKIKILLSKITQYTRVIEYLFSAYNGKLSAKYRLKTVLKTDERVRLMDEIISSVQVIKMYAWEKPFSALIELSRKLELKIVKKSSYIRGIYMMFGLFTNIVWLSTVR